MTTTFNTTHKDHALSRADQARSIAVQNRGTDAVGAIVADVGSALVHALLALTDAVNDHARDTR